MRRTLMQEIQEVRAMAPARGQLALDWLLMLAKQSDEFHFTALMVIDNLITLPEADQPEARAAALEFIKWYEFTQDVLSRPLPAALTGDKAT